jgi:UPF0755 protein
MISKRSRQLLRKALPPGAPGRPSLFSVPQFLFKLLGLAVLVGSLALGWLAMNLRDFAVAPMTLPEEGSVVHVAPGSTLRQVADTLHQQGAIAEPRYFVWLGRWAGVATQLKAGDYRADPHMTPEQLLDRIVAGQAVQYALTLVEGWTFRQVLTAVRADTRLEQSLAGLSEPEIMARLGAAELHPEGRFWPDTYHFARGTTDLEFLKRAYDTMRQELENLWTTRAEGLPLASPDEALTLASIVEKETAVPDEYAKIAGVFVRRLEKGMRLQTDPTVIYGLGERFDGNLRREDLQQDTPYNTYTRKGLPPTPIALPGKAALTATLHPQAGDALYFVARGDGSHYFSATLEEHNRAVREFQLRRP